MILRKSVNGFYDFFNQNKKKQFLEPTLILTDNFKYYA